MSACHNGAQLGCDESQILKGTSIVASQVEGTQTSVMSWALASRPILLEPVATVCGTHSYSLAAAIPAHGIRVLLGDSDQLEPLWYIGIAP